MSNDDKKDAELARECALQVHFVQVACTTCHTTTRVAVGKCDPDQLKCVHHFHLDVERDGIACACGLFVSGATLRAPGQPMVGGFTAGRRRPSDEFGFLKTENTTVLAENARLRRRIEDLERKKKR